MSDEAPAHKKLGQSFYTNTQNFLNTHNGNFMVTRTVVSDYRKQKDYEAAHMVKIHSFGIKVKGGECLESFATNFPPPPKPHAMIGIVAALLDASEHRDEWPGPRLEGALDKIWVDLNGVMSDVEGTDSAQLVDDFLALVESFYDNGHEEYAGTVQAAQSRLPEAWRPPPPES